MNTRKIDNILKKAEFYKKAAGLAGVILLGLPFISQYIRDKFIDTARGIEQASEALEKTFVKLDEIFKATSRDDFDALDIWYESFKSKITEYRDNIKDLVLKYKDLAADTITPEDAIKIGPLIDSIHSLGSVISTQIGDKSPPFLKGMQLVEDFGFSLGVHNNVRDVVDAIERLNKEIYKERLTIEELTNKILQNPSVRPSKIDSVKNVDLADKNKELLDGGKPLFTDVDWG